MIDHGQCIVEFPNFLEPDMIKATLQQFYMAETLGFCATRPKKNTEISDISLFPTSTAFTLCEGLLDIVSRVNEHIIPAMGDVFPPLQKYNLYVSGAKLQRTPPGGGYHYWHHEHEGDMNSNNTLLAWMVYLNDVEEGGETEFLYQKKKFSPKTSSLIVWPSGFTHQHRGNPPLSNDKFIATGWIDHIIL